MTRFFQGLSKEDRTNPETVARRYCANLAQSDWLISAAYKQVESPYYVSICTKEGGYNFADITRRATLVTDTLLLTHDQTGQYHELNREPPKDPNKSLDFFSTAGFDQGSTIAVSLSMTNKTPSILEPGTAYGVHCPDMQALGRWLLNAEPLLIAGLVWYLPSYSHTRYEIIDGVRHDTPRSATWPTTATSYLIKHGRAVDTSGIEPIKNKLVKHVLHADLPFIEGVNLRDFSKITIEEFGAYTAFRDFLRLNLLKIDDALNEVQSNRELLKIGLEINDAVRAMRAQMLNAQRKRALSMSGAVVGTVSTVLLAVYGPALATAITAIGATGGVWGFINAMGEHSTVSLREDKWYYVWALTRKGAGGFYVR